MYINIFHYFKIVVTIVGSDFPAQSLVVEKMHLATEGMPRSNQTNTLSERDAVTVERKVV